MEIVFLPKGRRKGTPVPLSCTSDSCYGTEISPPDGNGNRKTGGKGK